MIHVILGSIGFVLGVFLLIDLIDKILRWRTNPFSLPNVLAKPRISQQDRCPEIRETSRMAPKA